MSRKQCFVIMPFGEKTDVNGKQIDFDTIHEYVIEPAVKDAGLDCLRCDQIEEPGSIHAKMIEQIFKADVAVVDLSFLNANVFYELGVRHALRPNVTVLIRHKDTKVPFNLNGLNAIGYDHTDPKSVAETKAKITQFIRNALKSNQCDSLVHDTLQLRIGTASKPLAKSETQCYALIDAPQKSVCITTGDILKLKGVDVWVNSENTYMQMARFYDGSVSSAIRYYGAERDPAGRVTRDVVADALSQIVGNLGSVAPATVIATDSGQLKKSNGVKQIFHAASVQGSIGKGYQPITNLPDCITNALTRADADELQDQQLTSIAFPLLGAGTARGDLQALVAPLVEAAIDYLRENPGSRLQRVHFMAFNEAELAACRSVLERSADVVNPPTKPPVIRP